LALLSERPLADALREMLATRASADKPHALILFDIDQLSRANQSHGRLVGDRVLEGIATILWRLVRHDGWTAVRTGDDEFAVLLRAAKQGAAESFADAVRSWVRRLPAVVPGSGVSSPTFEPDGVPPLDLSISAGIATARSASDGGADGRHLVAAAREALRSAKRAGGDRVSIA
jgi:diguanylate cyclase (GGDEF)-like protein